MRERPILFSGPMVRAILDGRKSQTRRVLLDRRGVYASMGDKRPHPAVETFVPRGGAWWQGASEAIERQYVTTFPRHGVECPYGIPGDRLWVRETFTTTYAGKYGAGAWNGLPMAISPDREKCAYYREGFDRSMRNWTPSIFMPRWASRLTLEVTEVRVQRLQDISHSREDAVAEGWDPAWRSEEFAEEYRPLLWYSELWDSLNGKRAPWESNPWVWAISFAALDAGPRA